MIIPYLFTCITFSWLGLDSALLGRLPTLGTPESFLYGLLKSPLCLVYKGNIRCFSPVHSSCRRYRIFHFLLVFLGRDNRNDFDDDATGVGTREIPLRPPNVRADAEGYRRAGSPLPETERR